jgi:AcrR family transcriptional regulator
MPPRDTLRKSRLRSASGRTNFHHGNLKEALIEATLRLVEEGGAEKVTVREAARRAGVSSGAPFRHFPDRTALMTAVAEQAMARFRAEIVRALSAVTTSDPLARFRALGHAYFRWLSNNPTHFRIISDRTLIDFEGSESLRRDNDEIRALMADLLEEAQRQHLIRPVDIAHTVLAARALSYGLGRMCVDGHFAQWDVPSKDVRRAWDAVFDLFLEGLASPRPLDTGQRSKG